MKQMMLVAAATLLFLVLTANQETLASTGSGVELLRFSLQSEGGGVVNDINIVVAPQPSPAGGLGSIVNSIYLYADGEPVGSEHVDAGNPTGITFDDLDLTIDKDEEVEFVVKVDLNDAEVTIEQFNWSNGTKVTITGDDSITFSEDPIITPEPGSLLSLVAMLSLLARRGSSH